MSKEKEDPPTNPDFVSAQLCVAYRDAIKKEIQGIRNTIIVGLSVSTTILTLVMLALQLLKAV